MKLQKLLLSALVLVSLSAYAQNDDCTKLKSWTGEQQKLKNYAGAITLYLQGEIVCGNYDKAIYERMIQTIRNQISTDTSKLNKLAYVDTLLSVYDRVEKKGFYDESNDVTRAFYMMQASNPNSLTT